MKPHPENDPQARLPFAPAIEMSPQRVGEMIGCNQDTAVHLVRSGRLRGYQATNGRWRIDYQSVVEFMSATPNPRGLSVKRAASIIGCSKDTVHRLIEEGRLVGHRWREQGWWHIDYQSLVEYLASLKPERREAAVVAQRTGRG